MDSGWLHTSHKKKQTRKVLDGPKSFVSSDQDSNSARIQFVFTQIKLSQVDKQSYVSWR